MENIYADFGKIINNERYIKRYEIEKNIINRVKGKIFGSYSLVGIHRIGKSTVVTKVFEKNSNDIVIFITISTIKDVKNLFNKIAKSIYKKIKKVNLLNEEIDEIYKEYKECDFDDEGMDIFLEFIEVVIEESDKKLIIILDEFDAIVEIFKKRASYFQKLREMAIQERYNTAFIFISRRLIEEIEIKLNNVSNLRGVLKVDYIKPYDEKEIKEYFDILNNFIKINDEIINFYKETTGFYPYLMDILSYYIIEEMKENIDSITVKEIKLVYEKYKVNEFYSQYDKLKSLLIEEKLFDTLINFIFEKKSQIEKININKLKNYGLINKDNEIFCKSFRDFIIEEIEALKINMNDGEHLKLYRLKETIENLILLINESRKNTNRDIIFIDTPSLAEISKNLSTPAINKIIFQNFAGAIYLTVFERTKNRRNGKVRNLNTLPNSFRREHQFVKIIDSLRHNFGGHDTRNPYWRQSSNQLSRNELLNILKGNCKELKEDDKEYLYMQIKVLEMFNEYLNELYKVI